MSETTATGSPAGIPADEETPRRDLSPVEDKSTKAVAGSKLSLGHSLGLVLALGALIALGVITGGDRFLSVANLMVILQQAAVIGVISIGVTFVITSGGIDLSVGSVMGLATIWATTLGTQAMATDIHWSVMFFTALAVGAAAGVINGVIIAYGKVVPFIATLAMLVAARGFAELISGRQTQIVNVQEFNDVFRGDFLGISIIVWMFLIVAAAGWFVLNRTTFGRRTIAVGGNAEAARLAGIKVNRHLVMVYTLAGLCAGIAAVMMISRTTSGSSTHGYLYELDAIAAVVIGGTLLAGGRGTIFGTVLGVLVFAVLTNVFVQNNLDSSVQAVVSGAIIVAAVLLQQRFSAHRTR
ncbi:ABC transporter permease [Nesterenkonia sandarakina]|uniref:Monosaccharide ABC transporter membrane protein (CUT2 family) n=1 Tax=Nesterenkonia sandarakina TaxID=272918 RepID=A0A2T0YQI1_9MICC|nr:ABC transporter permease [Nesterenkonia sandarakina]PRZ17662.1 monosaccharide ABC transporter membrane protein (CUT2 family) [Nesterenkonia sandarakina]